MTVVQTEFNDFLSHVEDIFKSNFLKLFLPVHLPPSAPLAFMLLFINIRGGGHTKGSGRPPEAWAGLLAGGLRPWGEERYAMQREFEYRVYLVGYGWERGEGEGREERGRSCLSRRRAVGG